MSQRKLLELGVIGKVPIDTLFELYLETNSGDLLTFYQTRCQASLGGWVYEAAACLAKYLETPDFRSRMTGNDAKSSTSDACAETLASPEADSNHPLRDKTVVELGAGTGIVGILASYYGSKSIITDLESLVPLIQFNIDRNVELIRGSAVGQPLCWGTSITNTTEEVPDYLVLANCVYYEGSLEPLLETVLELTDQRTVVLACYEERTPEIKSLVGRWHALVERYFELEEVDKTHLQNAYWREYVRVVLMRRKEMVTLT